MIDGGEALVITNKRVIMRATGFVGRGMVGENLSLGLKVFSVCLIYLQACFSNHAYLHHCLNILKLDDAPD